MASTVVGSSPGPPAEIWWTRTRGASGTGSTGGGRLTGVSPTGAGAATAGAGRADGGAPQPAPAILEATAAPTAGSGAGAARPFAAAAPPSAAPLWTGPGLYVVCMCVGAAPPAPPTITGLILRRPSAPRELLRRPLLRGGWGKRRLRARPGLPLELHQAQVLRHDPPPKPHRLPVAGLQKLFELALRDPGPQLALCKVEVCHSAVDGSSKEGRSAGGPGQVDHAAGEERPRDEHRAAALAEPHSDLVVLRAKRHAGVRGSPGGRRAF